MAGSRMTDQEKLTWILACRDEADQAKRTRMVTNQDNYNMFHLKHDFSHKQEGQSTEVLSKQAMAVEQIKSFFQQALVDIGDWWKCECAYPDAEYSLLIRPHEITKLTNYMLEKAMYFTHVGDSVQSALLGSLAISKTYGKSVPKPKFISRKKGRGKQLKRWVEKVEDDTWALDFKTISHQNYYPDPTGNGLYEIEDMWVDMHEVFALSEGDDAIYDKEAVSQIHAGTASDSLMEYQKSRETGQNTTSSGHRPQVKLTEFWGTIINPTTGEIEDKNCVATIANDTILIRKPESNPNWSQRSPYTVSPLMQVANSVWHKAPMDAPTQHNRAMIELYNLFVDAAMEQVHSVKQIRVDCLDNPAQVSDGIKPGTTISVNSMLQPGMKVMEPLTQTVIPQDAVNIYNIMGQEYNASALTNDLRQGVMPFRAVKATEVVEASQTITSVFQGMAKNYESRQSTKELELAWMTTAQNWDKISPEEFISLFGKERGEQLSQMSPQDVFANTVDGVKFRVFGISLTLAKNQDFRKYMQLMQTVFANQVLTEEFMKKYDPGKFLGEIMTSLDIDKAKIEIPLAQQNTMASPQGAPPEGQPDMNSQTPQAGAGSLADMFSGGSAGIPQASFPGSPATAGGGPQ